MKILKICQHCGKMFTANTTVTRFCSKKCNDAAYKKRIRSESPEQPEEAPVSVQIANTEKKTITREFLSVRETSELLGCSVQTIYRLVNKGILKAVNLSERMTRIRRSELDKIWNVFPEEIIKQ